MAWKSIRLELANTSNFPRGSASRVYMLRLPLHQDGVIDAAEVEQRPARATVRRFWPSQPDLSGNVVRTPAGWAFAYSREASGSGTICQPGARIFRLGEEVVLTEPNGSRLPFRVASLERLK